MRSLASCLVLSSLAILLGASVAAAHPGSAVTLPGAWKTEDVPTTLGGLMSEISGSFEGAATIEGEPIAIYATASIRSGTFSFTSDVPAAIAVG